MLFKFSEFKDYITFDITLVYNVIDKDFEKFSNESLLDLAQRYIGERCFYDTPFGYIDCKIDNTEIYHFGEVNYVIASCYIPKTEAAEHVLKMFQQGKIKQASISCSVNKKICSICGRNNIVDVCEHIPGKTYNNKLCYHSLDNVLQVYEWSLVDELEDIK